MYVGTSYLVCSYERRYVGALGIGESGLVGVGRGWLEYDFTYTVIEDTYV